MSKIVKSDFPKPGSNQTLQFLDLIWDTLQDRGKDESHLAYEAFGYRYCALDLYGQRGKDENDMYWLFDFQYTLDGSFFDESKKLAYVGFEYSLTSN